MKKKLFVVILFSILISSCKKQNNVQSDYSMNKDTIVQASNRHIKFIIDLKNSYVPDSGFVPNKEVAVKIAKAIWYPIYNEEDKDINYKNYAVALIGDTAWIVTRNVDLSSKVERNSVTITLCGEPYILIRKKDGKILKVTHTE